MTADVITGVVSTLGVAGSLVWYLYYNTSKVQPEMRKEFSDTIATVTKTYTDSIEKVGGDFSQTLQDERRYRREEIDALKTWIRTEASCKYNNDRQLPESPINIETKHQ